MQGRGGKYARCKGGGMCEKLLDLGASEVLGDAS